jgi:hypothetical protein
MQEAKILHIEDSIEWQDTVAWVLSKNGLHRVVAAAETLTEAKNRFESIQQRKLEANAILLDGHLRAGGFMNHPRVVMQYMKESRLSLPVIGLSLDGLAEQGLVVGQHLVADIKKGELADDPGLLGRVLDELPEPN